MLLLFFSILACNTSNTKWLFYSLSQHLTRLANDFPALFCLTGRVYQYAHTNFFSFGLYHLNQLKKEKKKNLYLYTDKKKQKKKKKKSIYACILINKISKKKKSTIFFYFGVENFKHLMACLQSSQAAHNATHLLRRC